MNYFEIFNKVLLELNYRPIQTFEGIYKSEHKKILNAINLVNNEVLSSFEWPFLLNSCFLDIIAGEKACKLPFKGQIKSVYLNGEKFLFVPNAEKLLMEKLLGNFYSVLNDVIIFPKSSVDRVFHLFYYTNDFARAEDGSPKAELEAANDISILPMPYAEQILVYGTCLKAKANPAYPKFGFWNTMYIQALRNLRQKSSHSVECEPSIKIS